MVGQQQKRSPGLATLAPLSLAAWLALYGLVFWYAPRYRSSCSGEICGYALLGPLYVFVGTGALLGTAAWLGATVRAVRQCDVLGTLSLAFLLVVTSSTPCS